MKFKHKKDMSLFFTLHPYLILIFSDLNAYAYEKHGIQLTITETVSTSKIDKMLNRVSKSHLQRRALDIRTRDIDIFIVNDLVNYINNKRKFKKYHYMSTSGVERLAYFHNNSNGDHIHLAIHSRYALD